MSIEHKIEESRTKTVEAVFLNTTNHYDTLFGETALHWMERLL